MKGEPSGAWDNATQTAMQRYQADHDWQSKVVPDSRALISLGLGPDHDHLLNPGSAMTTGPQGNHPVSTPLSTVSVPSKPSSTPLSTTNAAEPATAPSAGPATTPAPSASSAVGQSAR